jgi:hypothetical protein
MEKKTEVIIVQQLDQISKEKVTKSLHLDSSPIPGLLAFHF